MINLTYPRTGVMRRYLSNVIDYFILFAVFFGYGYLFGEPNDRNGYTVTGFATLGIPLLWTLYFPLCECLFGQTPGKKVFDLHVVNLQGENPDFIQAFLRRCLDLIELATLGLPSIVTIHNSPKNQRVGDMLAHTHVVSTSAKCRFCSAEAELTSREVLKEAFVCPACNQVN